MSGFERLRDQLRMQLGFLERSADLYDKGHFQEAIRIAVTIRVLLHQTAQSKSLLAQIAPDRSIGLLSTCMLPKAVPLRVDNRRVGSGVEYHGLLTVENGAVAPQLAAASTREMLASHDWWEQVVYLLADRATLRRRNIVLVAANKDGGAHVDPEVDPQYAQLVACDEQCSFLCERTGAHWQQTTNRAHFAALRQMAYELLSSPSLWDLTDHSSILEKTSA